MSNKVFWWFRLVVAIIAMMIWNAAYHLPKWQMIAIGAVIILCTWYGLTELRRGYQAFTANTEEAKTK